MRTEPTKKTGINFVLIIINAFLLGVCYFSVSKYTVSLNEKNVLLDNIEDGKTLIAVLNKEKQNLLQTIEKEKESNNELAQRNLLLKRNLRAGAGRIEKLFDDFARMEQSEAELNSQISMLKQENEAVKEEKEKLEFDLDLVARQNEELNARLSSVSELKRTLKELKRMKIKDTMITKNQAQNEKVLERNLEGNKGFMIKDGASFSAVKVKIEVKPALKYE